MLSSPGGQGLDARSRRAHAVQYKWHDSILSLCRKPILGQDTRRFFFKKKGVTRVAHAVASLLTRAHSQNGFSCSDKA
jgi:hypothetical protein